jgi:hypothetical protein
MRRLSVLYETCRGSEVTWGEKGIMSSVKINLIFPWRSEKTYVNSQIA